MNTKRLLLLLLVPFLLLSANRIGSTRLLGCHHFRQAHTAMAAHNYARHDANLLRPTIDGVTYGKDLYLNEFPLYPYLVGLLWRIFGEHLVLARLLSVACMVLALVYYYRLLVYFFSDRLVTGLAVLVMSLTPVISYFGRCVERQSLFLALLLMGTYGCVVYVDQRKRSALATAGLGLGLAILLNPFAVYMAIPLLWYTWKTNGPRGWLDWRLHLTAMTAIVPALIWYGYTHAASRGLATASMMAIHENRSFFSAAHYAMWSEPAHWEQLFKSFARFVVPSLPAVLVFLYGVIRAPRDKGFGFFRVWLAAVVAYHLVDFYPVAVVIHQYYFMNLAPLTSLFFAFGLVHLGRMAWTSVAEVVRRDGDAWLLRIHLPRRRSAWLAGALAVAAAACFLLGAIDSNRQMHRDYWHSDYYALEETLEDLVPSGRRLAVVAESDDPLLSYLLTDRVTHRLIKYDHGRLDQILRQQDFDYLAIVWDTDQFPAGDAARAVEQAGCLGKPILQTRNLMLYQRGRGPAGNLGLSRFPCQRQRDCPLGRGRSSAPRPQPLFGDAGRRQPHLGMAQRRLYTR